MPAMVKIPQGAIALRDDRVGKTWTAEIEPFLLAAYPVTQALYREVTNESPSASAGDRHPVESVSWFDAIRFCNLLSEKSGLTKFYLQGGDASEFMTKPSANGFRLPTDAEWEYSCKAGSSSARYGNINDIAWYRDNSPNGTSEVGMKEANAWGLYDMLGNVWEWCWDLYDADVYGEYRVFRGGGWSDQERGCLATNRRRSHPTFRIDDLGFRIARSV